MAALVGVTYYVVHNRAGAPLISTVAGLIPGSLYHVHNFHWTQMKAGEQQWVLTARDANYSNDKTSLILNDPIVTMVSKDGKSVIVKAPKAVLDVRGGKVKRATLSGGTEIHYGDLVLNTEQASFMPDADQVDAPGSVTIHGEGIKVTGIGMTGHTKTREFALLKQVTTDHRTQGATWSGFEERLKREAGLMTGAVQKFCAFGAAIALCLGIVDCAASPSRRMRRMNQSPKRRRWRNRKLNPPNGSRLPPATPRAAHLWPVRMRHLRPRARILLCRSVDARCSPIVRPRSSSPASVQIPAKSPWHTTIGREPAPRAAAPRIKEAAPSNGVHRRTTPPAASSAGANSETKR